MDRKDFFKKTCLSTACLCGFGSIAAINAKNKSRVENAAQENKNPLPNDWLASLLSNLDAELDPKTLRKIIKKSAIVHYNNLKMDEMLADYVGNLDKFVSFIEEKWQWKIDYDKSAKTLIADENKNHCVCPVLPFQKGKDTSAICYCSEGFAEKMFSTVTGTPVKATVISSVRKGNETCKYKIILS